MLAALPTVGDRGRRAEAWCDRDSDQSFVAADRGGIDPPPPVRAGRRSCRRPKTASRSSAACLVDGPLLRRRPMYPDVEVPSPLWSGVGNDFPSGECRLEFRPIEGEARQDWRGERRPSAGHPVADCGDHQGGREQPAHPVPAREGPAFGGTPIDCQRAGLEAFSGSFRTTPTSAMAGNGAPAPCVTPDYGRCSSGGHRRSRDRLRIKIRIAKRSRSTGTFEARRPVTISYKTGQTKMSGARPPSCWACSGHS
jgi:hypothetical protein